MLSFLSNKKTVNSLKESNSQVSVNVNTSYLRVSSNSLNSSPPPTSFVASGNILINLLHCRFGHLNKHTLQTIIKNLSLNNVSNSNFDFVMHINMEKCINNISQLLKSSLSHHLNCYYWLMGLASKCSMDGYKYYTLLLMAL